MKLFYEPNNAYFGDCMPFYHDGTFYVFHQRDARNPRPFEPLNGLWRRQKILFTMKIKESQFQKREMILRSNTFSQEVF